MAWEVTDDGDTRMVELGADDQALAHDQHPHPLAHNPARALCGGPLGCCPYCSRSQPRD
jgi:hypothetical protein